MPRATLILRTADDRSKAIHWIAKAPTDTVLDFKWGMRSLPQNDRLHAMLTVLAKELEWHGQKLSVDDWKLIFMDGLKRELRLAPNLNGDGFVNLGRKTSKLTKDDFTALMDLVEMFAAKHGVDLGECDDRPIEQ